MTEPYWSPNEIQFTREQVKWLISLLPLLRNGVYPRSPTETGYTNAPSKRQIKAQAPFITASEIAGELDWRLCQCREYGLFLEMVYSTEDTMWNLQHISSALKVDINVVERNVHMALRFVCGKNRKGRSYSQFRNHKGGKNQCLKKHQK